MNWAEIQSKLISKQQDSIASYGSNKRLPDRTRAKPYNDIALDLGRDGNRRIRTGLFVANRFCFMAGPCSAGGPYHVASHAAYLGTGRQAGSVQE